MPGRTLLFVLAALLACLSCADRASDRDSVRASGRVRGEVRDQPLDPWVAEREAMVRGQIESRGIDDPALLAAMRRVPRHRFVPEDVRERSYQDSPLPIGYGQTISQPYIVALMTSLLHLDGRSKVLEIGTGSGYQAAVLAEIADSVYTIEIVEPLARRAEDTLRALGYENIRVRVGDGFLGWPEAAPFDGIIVTCAPRDIPPPLIEQLAEGGRLVIPCGESAFQELLLVEKEDGQIRRRSVLPVRFVPLTGPHGEG